MDNHRFGMMSDAFIENKNLGKLFLGQGSTSTDTTAERDLSGATVVIKMVKTARKFQQTA